MTAKREPAEESMPRRLLADNDPVWNWRTVAVFDAETGENLGERWVYVDLDDDLVVRFTKAPTGDGYLSDQVVTEHRPIVLRRRSSGDEAA